MGWVGLHALACLISGLLSWDGIRGQLLQHTGISGHSPWLLSALPYFISLKTQVPLRSHMCSHMRSHMHSHMLCVVSFTHRS
jgi:hypothetical protein